MLFIYFSFNISSKDRNTYLCTRRYMCGDVFRAHYCIVHGVALLKKNSFLENCMTKYLSTKKFMKNE